MLNSERKSQVCISVIMPSLNVAQYIRECMESVLKQTLQEIEVLCVDAGSTDGTLEILEGYAAEDARVRIIKSDQKSYGHQINLGIKAASGQYIGIVETDDFIDASMYQNLYSYVGNDAPDFVKCGFYDYAEIGERKLICESSLKGLPETIGKLIDLQKEREKGFLVLNHIWAGVYRRDFLLEKGIRFNETPGASYQDTSFSMLVGLLADIGIYIEGSYYYYRRNNEHSSVKSSAKWRCVVDELEYVTQEMIKKGKYSVDTQLLIWKYKPIFYFWNFLRLPEKERGRFLAEIRWELEKYTEDSTLYHSLSDGQKEMVEVMKNQEASECYFAKKEELGKKYEKLIALIKQGGKCVLISAGRYGEKMLLLQEMMGIKYIDAVADNDTGRQGCVWNGYLLMSISEAVHKYGRHWFVVANRQHSEKLREQLAGMGIHEDQILVFDEILSAPEMIELVAGGEF